jgi:hypothetical protein
MDMSRFAEAEFRIRHQHKDGKWAALERDRSHHTAAEHDAERGWTKGWVMRCVSCPEVVIVDMPDEAQQRR